MEVEELSLKGAKVITPKVFADTRGFFLESYQKKRYEEAGIFSTFVQDNHSFSKKGVLRGMHFQERSKHFPGQDKLICVISGEIYDVIVDIRVFSPTFKKWEGVVLGGENRKQLFVPVGFAHGFCVLSKEAHVLYKVSAPYQSDTEKGFAYNDPEVGISWPIKAPLLSLRDQTSPPFRELELYS